MTEEKIDYLYHYILQFADWHEENQHPITLSPCRQKGSWGFNLTHLSECLRNTELQENLELQAE